MLKKNLLREKTKINNWKKRGVALSISVLLTMNGLTNGIVTHLPGTGTIMKELAPQTVQAETTDDFKIENGLLSEYTGNASVIVIPDGVTRIGQYAFENNSDITQVVIPQGVTSIGDGAFANCENLRSVSLPDGLVSIGESAFSGCTLLSDIKIPITVERILSGAFSGCENLDVQTIGLEKCENLKELHLDELQITDIQPIKGLENLKLLYLEENQIADISPLIAMKHLQYLTLQNNKIATIEEVKALGLEYITDIKIAGNPIDKEDLIAEKVDYPDSQTIVTGMIKKFYTRDFPADNYRELVGNGSHVQVASQDSDIVEIADCNNPSFVAIGKKTGTTVVTVTTDAVVHRIEVTVVDEIEAPKQKASTLPKLESGYGDMALLSYNDAIITYRDRCLEKTAQINNTDQKYIARIVYNDVNEKACYGETLILDENNSLWSWSENTREEVKKNVIDIDGAHVTKKNNKNQSYITLDKDGNIKQLQKVLFSASNGTVKSMGYGNAAHPLGYCLTTDNKVYWSGAPMLENVKTVYHSRNNIICEMEDHTWRDKKGITYEEGVTDSIKSWDNTILNIQKSDGWYAYNREQQVFLKTEYKVMKGDYGLTADGSLYYKDVKLMDGVDHFVSCNSWKKIVYIIGIDGSLWCHNTYYNYYDKINTPDYVSSLENIAEVSTQMLNPAVVDKPLSGDADRDGKVTLSDAQLLLKAALKIINTDDIALEAADVDHNPGIQLADAQLVLKRALFIIDSL